MILSVWWDFKGIIFFELLSANTTINSEVCSHQLDKLNDSLKQKTPELFHRKGIVFHQDNARPHTSFVTPQKLLQLGWDVLYHTHPICQNWHHRIITCSGPCKICYTSKPLLQMKVSKMHWISFCLQRSTFFWTLNNANGRKMAKVIGPKWAIYNLIKYLYTIRKASFIFTKKTKWLSELSNIFLKIKLNFSLLIYRID